MKAQIENGHYVIGNKAAAMLFVIDTVCHSEVFVFANNADEARALTVKAGIGRIVNIRKSEFSN